MFERQALLLEVLSNCHRALEEQIYNLCCFPQVVCCLPECSRPVTNRPDLRALPSIIVRTSCTVRLDGSILTVPGEKLLRRVAKRDCKMSALLAYCQHYLQ